MGPVINRGAYHDYQQFSEELQEAGRLLNGGKVLTDGLLAKGYFVAPTLVDNLPYDHRLWKHDVPAHHHHRQVHDLNEAMRGQRCDLRPTAGIYGSQEGWGFFENIEAGVTYSNRRRASPPARGPASSPSAAGRVPARPANAGGLYTCRRTCANRSTTGWPEANARREGRMTGPPLRAFHNLP